MRFSRTETSLKALFGRKQLTLNDVLDLFYDLGADIRDDQKMTVDRLPAEQEEAAVTRLVLAGPDPAADLWTASRGSHGSGAASAV